MSRTLRALALGAALVAAASPAHAHVRLRAVVSLDPAQPISGEPFRVEVRIESLSGEPVALMGVSLVAEMQGHAMRPVEADLEPTATAGRYEARVTLGMAGPWRLRVQVDDGHDAAAAVADLPLEVADAAAPDPPPAAAIGPVAVELEAPPPERGASPWVILLAAVGLTVAAEGLAIARKLRRERQAPSLSGTRAAPPTPGGR